MTQAYLRNRYYDPATGRFMTEDPAKDGLNWYVYCGGNPVNFADPSGLAVYRKWVDNYITNMRDLSEQQVSNISSVLNANSSGFVTEEAMLANIVQNGGILREEKKLPGLSATTQGNRTDFTIYVQYGTNGVENDIFFDSGRTYKQWATEGIETYWSGTLDGHTIKTTVVEADPAVYQVYAISITNQGGSSSTPFVGAHRVNLRFNFVEEADRIEDQKTGTIVGANTQRVIMYNAAHEIGHAAFKFNDNVHNDTHLNVKEEYSIGGLSSIMVYANVPKGVQSIDLAMLMLNYRQGFQNMYYAEYPEILDKYAPGWGYYTH